MQVLTELKLLCNSNSMMIFSYKNCSIIIYYYSNEGGANRIRLQGYSMVQVVNMKFGVAIDPAVDGKRSRVGLGFGVGLGVLLG